MTRKGILVVLFFLFLGLMANRPVYAQDNSLDISASYTFGQRLNFLVQLPAGHSATQLTIQLTVPASGQNIAIELGPDFLQENPVTYSASIADLGIPPFAEIYYSLSVAGPDGLNLHLPEKQLYYEDDRLAWQSQEADGTIVYWVEGDEEVPAAVQATLAASLPSLQERVPVDLPAPLRIYLYPSAADLRSALRLNGMDWTAGAAIPELGVILLAIPNARTAASDLERLLPHELSHLLLFQALGADYEQVPTWLDEGLATLAEGQPNPNQALLLERALTEGSTLSFSELCAGFPVTENEAVLAYAQSGSLLAYIEAEYGRAAITRLVRSLADGASCESAVSDVLGISLAELEGRWLIENQPQAPVQRFFRQNLFWLVMVAFFGVVTLLLVSNPTVRQRRF
ncbi:MAG: hypothetical protein KDE59_26020 [Anaerolineales bacterium]|nr:hypothetical protein [Anaerolineales bacterium]